MYGMYGMYGIAQNQTLSGIKLSLHLIAFILSTKCLHHQTDKHTRNTHTENWSLYLDSASTPTQSTNHFINMYISTRIKIHTRQFFLMKFVPHSIIYYEQNVFELSILLGLNFKTIKFNNPLFERSKSFDEISSWQELYSILSKRKELYSKSIHNWISKWIVPIVEIPSRLWWVQQHTHFYFVYY